MIRSCVHTVTVEEKARKQVARCLYIFPIMFPTESPGHLVNICPTAWDGGLEVYCIFTLLTSVPPIAIAVIKDRGGGRPLTRLSGLYSMDAGLWLVPGMMRATQQGKMGFQFIPNSPASTENGVWKRG